MGAFSIWHWVIVLIVVVTKVANGSWIGCLLYCQSSFLCLAFREE